MRELSITAPQTASVFGRLQDHGVIARGDSSFEWYRSCGSISDSNFATHVAGCLAEAPIDGLCKSIAGKNFPDYSTTNYIGMMPYWDVSAVTNMNGAFENQVSFNADISSWDVSSVTTMEMMFKGALNFTQELSVWSIGSAEHNRHVPWCDKHFRQRARARAQTTGLRTRVQLTKVEILHECHI